MVKRQPPRGETSFLIYTPPDFYYKTELTANMNGWSYDKLKLYRFQQAIANAHKWNGIYRESNVALYILMYEVYDGAEENDPRFKSIPRYELSDSYIHTLSDQEFRERILDEKFFKTYGYVVYNGTHCMFERFCVSWVMAERITRVIGRDVLADAFIEDAVRYHGYHT